MVSTRTFSETLEQLNAQLKSVEHPLSPPLAAGFEGLGGQTLGGDGAHWHTTSGGIAGVEMRAKMAREVVGKVSRQLSAAVAHYQGAVAHLEQRLAHMQEGAAREEEQAARVALARAR